MNNETNDWPEMASDHDYSTIACYLSGLCNPNPGRGRWAVFFADNKLSSMWGSEPYTTNNAMELTAAINAIEAIPREANLTIYSASSYLIDGMNERIKGWRAQGGYTSSDSPIKNLKHWKDLYHLTHRRAGTTTWKKAEGEHLVLVKLARKFAKSGPETLLWG